jgi:hypothetical protein
MFYGDVKRHRDDILKRETISEALKLNHEYLRLFLLNDRFEDWKEIKTL